MLVSTTITGESFAAAVYRGPQKLIGKEGKLYRISTGIHHLEELLGIRRDPIGSLLEANDNLAVEAAAICGRPGLEASVKRVRHSFYGQNRHG